MTRGIAVLGLGGAGCRITHRLTPDLPREWLITMADTGRPAASVERFRPGRLPPLDPQQVRLYGTEVCQGKGCGGVVYQGLRAFHAHEADFQSLLENSGLLFAIVGLGGGTGSGGLAPLSKLATKLGAAFVVLATTPFTFEGRRRRTTADKALTLLDGNTDGLFVFPNDRIMTDPVPDADGQGMEEAMTAIDREMLLVIAHVAQAAAGKKTLADLEQACRDSALIGSWNLSHRLRQNMLKPPAST